MQTCAILEPEKESTSKEERPMKKVLILSGSPRKDGNSDLLCSEFMSWCAGERQEVQNDHSCAARRLCPAMPAITAATTAASVP